MSDPLSETRAPLASLVFVGLALLFPLPLLFFEASIPLARIALLTAVSLAVALTEGAAGPVTMITGMFIGHTLVYIVAILLASKLIARGLRRMPPQLALALVATVLAIGITFALLTRPYVTPFGRTPRSNLLEALS